MKVDDDQLLVGVPEAARRLGVSVWLGYELVKRGELPCVTLGGRKLVPVAEIERIAGSTGDEG